MNLTEHYIDALNRIPAPGAGCHPALLGVANLGILAGMPAENLFQDIRQAIPVGRRRITDKEITDAVRKAMSDHHTDGPFIPRHRPAPIVSDGQKALRRIIESATISDETDLWEASPLRLWEEPKYDPLLLLDVLFDPTDLVWIGDRHEPGILGKTIRTAEAWIDHFRNGGVTAPHIILNSLSGEPAPVKSGDKETLRGDACVKDFRYCLVEFDSLSHEEQICFWSAVKLPVAALIDSGGKSIHAWLDVQKLARVDTPEQWATEIKGRLYDRILAPLGVDSACSNPSRLSRLPGHLRSEKKSYQRLLWLSPEGQTIC